MSRENVEVVRRFNAPHENEDIVPLIRQMLEMIGPDPQPDTVLAFWEQDPAWRHAHRDIQWDTSATGVLGSTANGPTEVALWWAEWVQVWESYVYRILKYRDCGAWVLTPATVQARGREAIPIEMRIFQLWQVRDGRVAVYRAFGSEREALEAVGLRE
jgi:hypothetical protein